MPQGIVLMPLLVMDHLQGIWDQDQMDQWDHQKEIWDQDQMDQWDRHQKVIWDQDQMDQWDHLQEIWDQDQMDQWDHLRVIWDQDLTDLHQMIWVTCILIWMMQVHIMDLDLKDQMDLHQEQIWMATAWLRLLHQMIHLMM
jgi:hypothetical protein